MVHGNEHISYAGICIEFALYQPRVACWWTAILMRAVVFKYRYCALLLFEDKYHIYDDRCFNYNSCHHVLKMCWSPINSRSRCLLSTWMLRTFLVFVGSCCISFPFHVLEDFHFLICEIEKNWELWNFFIKLRMVVVRYTMHKFLFAFIPLWLLVSYNILTRINF